MAHQTSPTPVASLPPPPPIPDSGVVTYDQIQKYLDENKQLILAILDNQNLGKLTESAQFQAQLQRNLLFLAALADEQPQTKAIRAQMTPHGVMPHQQPHSIPTAQPVTVQPHQQPHSIPTAQPVTVQPHQQPHSIPTAQVYVAQPITEQSHQKPQNSLPLIINPPAQASVDQSTALPNEEENVNVNVNVNETEKDDSTALSESTEQEERKG